MPLAPVKIAQIIASFANTNGGVLAFGIAENPVSPNRFVKVSEDFQIREIVNKGIAMLSPTPKVHCDWAVKNEDNVFIISVDESEKDILLEDKKYIRKEESTVLENKSLDNHFDQLLISDFDRTVAIIICIEAYAPNNGISSVKYAKNDAFSFKEALISNLGVEEKNIHMYIDEQALKSSLLYDLKGLFHSLTERDRLVFYFVGHGFHNGVTNYLSTYDMHKQNIADTAISLRQIVLDPFSHSKCKTALFFIDACASTFEDENMRNVISNLDVEELKVFSSEQTYSAIFLSCEVGQSSYSCDTLKSGVWTYHLTSAISGQESEAIYKKRYITDRSLNDYLATSVARYIKDKMNYDQNPRAILDSNGEYVVSDISIVIPSFF
jgi:hypothetical protein